MLISLNNSNKLTKRQAMGSLFIISFTFLFSVSLYAKKEQACAGGLVKEIKVLSSNVNRAIAALEDNGPVYAVGTCQDFIYNHIQKFESEPGQRNHIDIVNKRMEGIFAQVSGELPQDTLHKFYRAWPNAFYSILWDELHNLKDEDDSINKLLEKINFIGQVPGDVHTQNYGSFVTRNEQNPLKPNVMVKINDFDETGEGPLMGDFLRLMGSAYIADSFRMTNVKKSDGAKRSSIFDTHKKEGEEKFIESLVKSYRLGVEAKENDSFLRLGNDDPVVQASIDESLKFVEESYQPGGVIYKELYPKIYDENIKKVQRGPTASIVDLQEEQDFNALPEATRKEIEETALVMTNNALKGIYEDEVMEVNKKFKKSAKEDKEDAATYICGQLYKPQGVKDNTVNKEVLEEIVTKIKVQLGLPEGADFNFKCKWDGGSGGLTSYSILVGTEEYKIKPVNKHPAPYYFSEKGKAALESEARAKFYTGGLKMFVPELNQKESQESNATIDMKNISGVGNFVVIREEPGWDDYDPFATSSTDDERKKELKKNKNRYKEIFDDERILALLTDAEKSRFNETLLSLHPVTKKNNTEDTSYNTLIEEVNAFFIKLNDRIKDENDKIKKKNKTASETEMEIEKLKDLKKLPELKFKAKHGNSTAEKMLNNQFRLLGEAHQKSLDGSAESYSDLLKDRTILKLIMKANRKMLNKFTNYSRSCQSEIAK